MVGLQYWNGESWTDAGGPFHNEMIAWISLGDDCVNYRTVDMITGRTLTDKREKVNE